MGYPPLSGTKLAPAAFKATKGLIFIISKFENKANA